MEIGVRMVLFLVGLITLAGIIWDFRRDRNRTPIRSLKKVRRQAVEEAFEESKIISLHVMARGAKCFSGKDLLEAFSDARLFFGEMNIFHRYETNDVMGARIFSISSAVEPGFFDLSKMDHFSTPGITLFFTFTTYKQFSVAFELMLRIAKQISAQLDGELQDENRRPLTPAAIAVYKSRSSFPQKKITMESSA